MIDEHAGLHWWRHTRGLAIGSFGSCLAFLALACSGELETNNQAGAPPYPQNTVPLTPAAGAAGMPNTGVVPAAGAAGTAGAPLGGAGVPNPGIDEPMPGIAPATPQPPAWSGAVGTWCGPADDETLWLVAGPSANTCDVKAQSIYGDGTSDGFSVALPKADLEAGITTFTLTGRNCEAGVCESTPVEITIDSYQATQGVTGSWGVTLSDGSFESGTLAGEWCAWDDFLPAHPEGTRLVRDIRLSQLAVYQAVKIPIMEDLEEVEDRNADLVQNRDALFRVFVEPEAAFQPHEVLARLTLDNGDGDPEVFEERIMIDGSSQDDDPDSTVNFKVPAASIGPNTQYAVELLETQPCAELSGAEVGARFPADGLAPVDARATGPVKVLLVPVRYQADGSDRLPDLEEEDVERLRADIISHFPATEIILSVRDPVGTNSTSLSIMLNQMQNLRSEEDPPNDLSYYGLVKHADTFREYCNRACVTGIASFGRGSSGGSGMGIGYGIAEAARTFTHEMGHVYQRPHSPCGGAGGPDRNFPYQGGGIGSWGYDVFSGEFYDPDDHSDFMGYCDDPWISDYVYQHLVNRVAEINDARIVTTSFGAAPTTWRTMLVDPQGVPRWGLEVSLSELPGGTEESATILDAFGQPLGLVTVYRQTLEDTLEELIYVPPAEVGWDSIALSGLPSHPFSAPVTVEPFSQ